MINKKGLSDLVATVLIVLLALAAVAIIWGFLKPAFDRTGEQIDLRSKCFSVDVKPLSCTYTNVADNADGVSMTVRVQHKNGEFQFVRAVLNGPDGLSVKSGQIDAPGQFGTGVFDWSSGNNVVDVSDYNPVDQQDYADLFNEVSVAAVVSDGVNSEPCVETTVACVYTPIACDESLNVALCGVCGTETACEAAGNPDVCDWNTPNDPNSFCEAA